MKYLILLLLVSLALYLPVMLWPIWRAKKKAALLKRLNAELDAAVKKFFEISRRPLP